MVLRLLWRSYVEDCLAAPRLGVDCLICSMRDAWQRPSRTEYWHEVAQTDIALPAFILVPNSWFRFRSVRESEEG
jgi:hypothetical protein